MGGLEPTGVWQPDPMKAPKLSMRSLGAGTREAQEKVLASDHSTEWTKEDQELWEEIQRKERIGNLQGSLTPQELEDQVGKLWIAARRFSIRQGKKLMPIDDFSEFGSHAAFGASEKVQMKNLDQVVAWSRAWGEAVSSGNKIVLEDTAGR